VVAATGCMVCGRGTTCCQTGRCRELDWGQRMARRRWRRTRSPPNCACVSRLSGFLPRGEARVFPPPWDGRIWKGLGRVFSPTGSNWTHKFGWVGISPPSGWPPWNPANPSRDGKNRTRHHRAVA
jgi:hypothetical protein